MLANKLVDYDYFKHYHNAYEFVQNCEKRIIKMLKDEWSFDTILDVLIAILTGKDNSYSKYI